MPPKKKQGSALRGSCSICCQPVLDKDDALFCDGKCQQWLHRYCGSVTEQQHKVITDSQHSFLCPCCDRERQQVEITELRDNVEAMKMELAQLKESLATLSAVQTEMASATSRSYASSASTYSGSGSGSYASAAKRSNLGQSAYGRRTRGRQPSSDTDGATKKAESSNVSMSATEPAVTAGKRPKIQVVGARRIWGTLRDSTVNSVKNVISRICKLENGIRVRRKTKVSPVSNKTKWWCVVHADEDLLTELNTKWDQVKAQTSWKLEPCFTFANTEGNNAAVASSQSQSHDSAQQVHDNEGIVHNEQASDLSTHSAVSQQPSTQPPVAVQVSDLSIHSAVSQQPSTQPPVAVQVSDLSTRSSPDAQQPTSSPPSFLENATQ